MVTILLVALLLITPLSDEKGSSMFFSQADIFFSKHVKDASVDYKSIQKSPEQLTKLSSTISAFNLKNVDKDTEMAFWINAYNILVIQGAHGSSFLSWLVKSRG
ncbi:DUF547 domain-containing protein [candidate division KSB1 bacterium]|nr:DUF547 domain-containing protein [candidate division KSB1 bacterium]